MLQDESVVQPASPKSMKTLVEVDVQSSQFEPDFVPAFVAPVKTRMRLPSPSGSTPFFAPLMRACRGSGVSASRSPV